MDVLLSALLATALPGPVAAGWRAPDPGPSPEGDGAAPQVESEPRAPRLVLAVGAGPSGVVDDVVDLLEIHLTRAGAEVTVIRGAEVPLERDALRSRGQALAAENGAKAVFWVDLSDAGSAGLYLVLADADPLRGRTIPLDPAAPAAGMENLANVVAGAAPAMVQGRDEEVPLPVLESGPQPDPEPRPEPPPASDPAPEPRATTPPPEAEARPSPPPPWRRLLLSAAYEGNTFADRMPWHSAAAFRLGWIPAPGAWLAVGYVVHAPHRLAQDDYTFELRRHPVTLGGGYGFSLGGGRWFLGPGARVSVDPIVRRSDGAPSDQEPSQAATRVFVGAAPTLGIEAQVVEALRFRLVLGPEFMITRADYLSEPGADAPLVAPYPVRFLLQLGLDIHLVPR